MQLHQILIRHPWANNFRIALLPYQLMYFGIIVTNPISRVLLMWLKQCEIGSVCLKLSNSLNVNKETCSYSLPGAIYWSSKPNIGYKYFLYRRVWTFIWSICTSTFLLSLTTLYSSYNILFGSCGRLFVINGHS